MQIDYNDEIKRIALKIKQLRKDRKLTVQELACLLYTSDAADD